MVPMNSESGCVYDKNSEMLPIFCASPSNSESPLMSKKRKVCGSSLNDRDHIDFDVAPHEISTATTADNDVKEFCVLSNRKASNDDIAHITQEQPKHSNLEYDEGMDVFPGPAKLNAGGNQDLDAAVLHFNRGQAFRNRNALEKAAMSYQLALNNILPYIAGFRSIPQKQVNRIAIPIIHNLGLVNYLKGSQEDSAGFFEFALAELRKSKAQRSFEVAATLNCLGNVLHHTKDPKNSLRYLKESAKIFTVVFGAGSKWEATVLNNIGRVYVGMGDYSAATLYFRQAMVIRRNLFGAHHLDYGASAFNAAQSLHSLGKFSEALTLYEEFLNIAESLFPNGHRDITVVLSCMAQIYTDQGKINLAGDLYDRSLRAGHMTLKSNPLELAVLMNRIGNFHFDNGNVSRALEVYSEGLNIEKKVLEENHPNITVTLSNIAEIHRQKGNLSLAIEKYNEVVVTLESRNGPASAQVAAALNVVGLIHEQTGDVDAALTTLKRALTIRRAAVGNKHEDVASTLTYLGTIYIRKNMLRAALDHLLESYRIHKEDLGQRHTIQLSFTAFNIGVCHQLQGDYEEAMKYYNETLQIQQSLPKDQQRDITMTLLKMGETKNAQGDLPDALKYLEQALDIQRKTSSQVRNLVKILVEVAGVYQATGQTGRTMEVLCEAARLVQSCGLPIDQLDLSKLAVLMNEFNVGSSPAGAA